MTMADFAKRRGVSKPCVSKWRTKGFVVLHDGLVDVAASEALLAQRPATYRGGSTRPTRPAPVVDAMPVKPPEAPQAGSMRPGDPSTWSTAEAIRQKEIAQARLRQIEANTAAGLIVPIADVAKEVADEYAAVRAALLSMPAKLAHRLAATQTPEEAGALLDLEVRAALAALTRDAA